MFKTLKWPKAFVLISEYQRFFNGDLFCDEDVMRYSKVNCLVKMKIFGAMVTGFRSAELLSFIKLTN